MVGVHKLIFILGIDALDYDLVEKLNLNNLKQLEYSKIVVPISKKIGIPSSPEVWASFLTGEHMPLKFSSKNNYIKAMKKILGVFRIASDNRFRRKANYFWAKLGFKSNVIFGSINRKTFLDVIKSNEINVPFYSFDHKTFQISHLFGHNMLSLAQAVKETKVIYENRKIQILNETNKINNNDLIFAFMHTTDILQHFSYLRFLEIKKHYLDLDNYVSILKRSLEDSFGEIIFIIVSDHGFDFKIGNHSMMGFYSCNTHLIPKPEKITDFYGIILELVKKSNGLSVS